MHLLMSGNWQGSCECFVKAIILGLLDVIFVESDMSKPQKKTLPIIPMLIAVVLLTLIFYVQSEVQPATPVEQEELTESSLSLPEDKIIKFVVDKVTDVMRLFPQKAHSTN